VRATRRSSHGSRPRTRKLNLPLLADRIQIPITVCHYPPGASKWNKIEHRLFSFISLNWRREPLIDYETIINLIGGTTTGTGVKVKVVPARTHPAWNYTISPHVQ